MKKLFATIALMSCILADISAQDRFIDHLAVGINIGTTSMKGREASDYIPLVRETDGLGLEAAAQFNDWLDARAGFSMTIPGKSDGEYRIEGIIDGQYFVQGIHIENRHMAFSGSLMFDFYPFKKTTFHFTAGAYAGSTSILNIYNTTPVPVNFDKYDRAIVEIHGVTIPTDKDGKINAELRMPAVRPYIGVGIGRPNNRRVNIIADLGIMYKGRQGMTIAAPDGSRIEVADWHSDHYIARMDSWARKCAVAPLLSVRLFVKIF